MASVNPFNGYDKISQSHLEGQKPQPKVARRRASAATIIIVSAILLLTLVIALVITALMLEKHINDRDPTGSVESVKTICNVTRYPVSCFTTLSPLNASKNPDPEAFLDLSLRVSITHLSDLASSFKSLNDLHSHPALKDCLTLFDDALSQLNDSVSAMKAKPGLTKGKMSDIQTWISAAMTDQDTCNDGLEEMGWTAGDEVKSRARRFKESVSNSLAIVANMQTLVHKFGLTMH
ncbi:Ribosomal protein S4 [Hibiscus syriacus]|uniref:pectinesterase n=1 Tax=Hibiscus syriacus TaxID=106335 RepID=A0A6A3CCP7_HIBSY|nr:pectinesterase 3-like [Hibiscus syriacus]KAE8727075.1 Ribosomal protein S4 [Hibiscus syriacus]